MHWENLPLVLFFSIVPAGAIVSLYALGIRLLTASGRTPVVAPLDFTDAITIVTPEEVIKNEKRAAKAAKKSPLTQAQKTSAFVAAWACFVLSGAVVLLGIWLILPFSRG
ncbi:MAG: peptidase [Agromyces sp.]